MEEFEFFFHIYIFLDNLRSFYALRAQKFNSLGDSEKKAVLNFISPLFEISELRRELEYKISQTIERSFREDPIDGKKKLPTISELSYQIAAFMYKNTQSSCQTGKHSV
jgi:hypothetical protein